MVIKKFLMLTVTTTSPEHQDITPSTELFIAAKCEQIAKLIENSMKQLSSWSTAPSSHLSVSVVHNVCSVHNKSAISWILDLGATDHIMFSVNFLQNPISHTSAILLSNGDTCTYHSYW